MEHQQPDMKKVVDQVAIPSRKYLINCHPPSKVLAFDMNVLRDINRIAYDIVSIFPINFAFSVLGVIDTVGTQVSYLHSLFKVQLFPKNKKIRPTTVHHQVLHISLRIEFFREYPVF